MRRFFVVCVPALLLALAVAPAFAGQTSGREVGKGSVAAKKPHCAKGKQAKKVRGKWKCVKAKLAPAATHTPTPTLTLTPTPTSTATATSTATPTPTVTSTQVPAPDTASIVVKADAPIYDSVRFFVCGLPGGVSAVFAPPAPTAVDDRGSSTGYAAESTMSVSTPSTVYAGTYVLTVRGKYEGPDGTPSGGEPASFQVRPRSVALTVFADHTTQLRAADLPAPNDDTSCTSLPSAYDTPTPTATPPLSAVQVSASVSNPTPAAGEGVTVTGKITLAGQPLDVVKTVVRWYLPDGIFDCETSTGADGTASCIRANSNALHGYVVQVQVIFTYRDTNFVATTSYTM